MADRFTLIENRVSGVRIQYASGRIIKSVMKRGMLTAEEKAQVDAARFEPEVLLDKLAKAIEAKADNKVLVEILNTRPDLESLAAEVC